jgi:hypothetical protein
MDESGPLSALASEQWGVCHRQQLLAAGVTPGELRWRLGRTWRLLLPGVVLLDPGLPSAQQSLVAALLLAGPRSWLSGPTAAALHGVPGVPDLGVGRRVHVLVPAPARPRDLSWVSVRRTVLTDERLVERGPLRYSCRPRAVVDAAASAATEDAARAIIIGSMQRRLVRPDDLAHWIEARRPNGRGRLRRALDEAVAGVWSVPEADLYAVLCSSSVLPAPMPNPHLRDEHGRPLTTPDLWIDDVGMAIMVHSRQFHEGALDWEATVEADADLVAAGVVVVPVTPGSISRAPRDVLARVEAAYLTARRSGRRAAVTASPRRPALPAAN